MTAETKFKPYDKVAFKNYPNIKGTFVEYIPAEDDFPGCVSVDMWIPEDEPGFYYTNRLENFWCDEDDLVAVQS